MRQISKSSPGGISQAMTRTIVRRIVEQFDPEQIILFGSHARNEAMTGSDIDLLVVMRVIGSVREKAIDIAVALHDLATAKDVFVVSPEDFAWRKSVIGTIEYPAAQEGKLLYARR